ncbi:unnamed protein product [Prorocentrum cordatum]|uniref:Uncharacterized protein n=1 Tax=Prorocentrum cordatum TaxID=2364126 RepID=A0ABN9TZ14_9DINO|nr:unnamed protein product [Polarella glacialis]
MLGMPALPRAAAGGPSHGPEARRSEEGRCGQSVGVRGHRTVWGLGSLSEDVSGDRLPGSQDPEVTGRAVRTLGMPRSPHGPSSEAQALLITEHTSGLWLSDGAMPAADAGAGKGDRAEPPSTPPSGHTAGGWSCARASRGQLCEGTRLGVECQGEAVPGPKWRLEVRNTFITIVFLGAPGSCRPLGRALSSPAAPRRR